MFNRSTRSLVTLAAVGALALGGGASSALAKHGADDPPGHDAGDDHGLVRGGDDPAGHDRNDDKGGKRKAARRAKHHRRAKHKHHRARAARHGADDPVGHDANDDNGGRRGGGNDDGPNHT